MILERIIARVGLVGILAGLLALSIIGHVWQFRVSASAEARSEAACAARIAGMAERVAVESARAEGLSLRLSRETAARAAAESARIHDETIRYVDRIRTIRVPVPAACHAPMPDGVRDALTDAARAANRRL